MTSPARGNTEEKPKNEKPTPTATPSPMDGLGSPAKGVNIRVSFTGSNLHSTIEKADPLDAQVSYFLGNDPSKWYAGVPVWGSVRYSELYPGLDLVVSSNEGRWVWQFIPGQGKSQSEKSDPVTEEATTTQNIRMKVEGAEHLSIEGNTVRIVTDLGDIILPLPKQDLEAESANLGPQEKSTAVPDASADNYRLEGNEIILPFKALPGSAGPAQNKRPIGRERLAEPESSSSPANISVPLSNHPTTIYDMAGESITLNSTGKAPLWDTIDLRYSTHIGPGDGMDIAVELDWIRLYRWLDAEHQLSNDDGGFSRFE